MGAIRQAIVRTFKKSGQTRYQLAKGSGVDYAALSRFLEGADIRLSTVELLADYLGLTVTTKGNK